MELHLVEEAVSLTSTFLYKNSDLKLGKEMMNLWHSQVYCLGAQACHLCDEAAFGQAWNKGHNTNPKIGLLFLDEIPRPT